MDSNVDKVYDLKIKRTMQNLIKNNMQAYCCDNSEQARELFKKLVKPGDTISHGGSETIKELGIRNIIANGDYNYLNRGKPGLSQEEIERIYRETYSADVYVTSANAVTERGELYNVDGNSNRVSAILYGPKSVIVFVGENKLVRNIDEAVSRVKALAAPANTIRLSCETPCGKTGECVSLSKGGSYICDGCYSPSRICCNYVVSAYQRHKDRIKVVIVRGNLGY